MLKRSPDKISNHTTTWTDDAIAYRIVFLPVLDRVLALPIVRGERMKATVLEIKGDLIYLQVGDQLRFKARFESPDPKASPHKADTVEFEFDPTVNPNVVIRGVTPTPVLEPPRR